MSDVEEPDPAPPRRWGAWGGRTGWVPSGHLRGEREPTDQTHETLRGWVRCVDLANGALVCGSCVPRDWGPEAAQWMEGNPSGRGRCGRGSPRGERSLPGAACCTHGGGTCRVCMHACVHHTQHTGWVGGRMCQVRGQPGEVGRAQSSTVEGDSILQITGCGMQ